MKFLDAAGTDLAPQTGEVAAATMEQAIDVVERAVCLPGLPDVNAVGYRVVHPGPHLRGHQAVTPELLNRLREAISFAPLHNPKDVRMIEEMQRRLPDVPHFVCFDAVFHETMPEQSTVYALPQQVRDAGVRRYGFHGLSCESVVLRFRGAGILPARLIIAHLGSGCSVTTCVDGKSMENSMGLTPTGGVVMGTRPGDLDPGVVVFLLRRSGATLDSVQEMLNRDAGLRALGGVNDMRELRARAGAGDAQASLAIAVFCRSVVKIIAGYVALYGADALVFTGGIGEHDSASRAEIVHGLSVFGVVLDEVANVARGGERLKKVSRPESRIAVYVAEAEEDLMIARHVAGMCCKSQNLDEIEA